MKQKIKMNYYDTFRCTADACTMSCCQQWRIGVDDETYDVWKTKGLCEHVGKDDSGHYMQLNHEKKCPYLTSEQLCQLVVTHGEEILSVTCTNFPRRINEFEEHMEFSLDTGCPAVVDLMNQVKGEIVRESALAYQETPELFKARDLILRMFEKEQDTLAQSLKIGFYVLLDLLEGQKKLNQLFSIYEKEEQLRDIDRAIQRVKDNPVDTFWERNELFLDMTTNYRYQKLYVDYLEPIAQVAQTLEDHYTDQIIHEKIQCFEAQFKGYQSLMREYIQAELLGGMVLSEMNFEDMVIAYEWVSIAYGMLRHMVFLSWHLEGESKISYEMVRDAICITSRVTGYGLDDIKEYMEKSFETPIWEWGYLALIVGK
ncbi:MAG: flagellin lysine-N-methylase [Cellulosilyticaceae bacterium]